MRWSTLLCSTLAAGCVAGRSAVRDDAALAVAPGARSTVVAQARELLGKRIPPPLRGRYGDDCTGLVRAAYASANVDLMTEGLPQDNGVTAIWRFASRYGRPYTGGRPVAGDLVFFRDTYDLNRDGVLNDGLTHVGIIDDVLPDGTAIVIHRVSRGVIRSKLSLQDPAAPQLNDWLRAAGALGPAQRMGQLFWSYATLLPNESVASR